MALTGGSSPRGLYGLLGETAVAREMPWEHVHLFWGDDRVVPPRHPRSNFRLAQDLFIASVPIPAGNVHRVRGEEGAERAAARYEREVRDFFGGAPRFDLVHLGLGEDGHVASLFPFDRDALLDRSQLARPALFRPLGLASSLAIAFGLVRRVREVVWITIGLVIVLALRSRARKADEVVALSGRDS